jgi:GntR family transcriptional regulator, transcriptional repressor for pyruvate dehydrogenase complex
MAGSGILVGPIERSSTVTLNATATPRRSRQVVEQFQAMLSSGDLVAGDRLPPERALAERFGVGRGSMREALRVLEILGFVESRHGAGTYVRASDSRRLMAPFRSVVALSSAAVDDVIEFRRIFEPEVAALAACNADDQGRALLQQALRRFNRALHAAADAADADVTFHEAVALCTGNPIVIAVQHALAELFAEFRTHLVESGYDRDHAVARGHQAVFGAIIAGDAEAARGAMLRHLDDVEAAIARNSVAEETT